MQNAVVGYALAAGSYFEVTVRGVEIDPVRFAAGTLAVKLDLECEFGTRISSIVMETVPAMAGELPRAIRSAVGDWTYWS